MKKYVCGYLLAAVLCLFSLMTYAAEVSESYQYDALGRLRQVHENSQLKVNYCYDAAGNRVEVSQADRSEQECIDLASQLDGLPKPGGATISSSQGGLYAHWQAVSGASYYQLSYNGQIKVISGLSYYSNENVISRFDWVQACDSSACGAKAYF